MNCPGCGRANREDAAFCDACGTRFARACVTCGRELRPDAAFCDGCGARTGEEARAAPERDPRSYTPKHLADKILQSKSALEGERKQVTVLFADIKGSMDMQEGIDAEDWHRIMDRFFEILTDGVHRFEGTVNQYTGDGIMALFGAPIAHEDHAQRACYAALRIRDGLRRFADELCTEHGIEFQTRIGLNSGDVIVGKIGNDLRMDYTAQGQTVGLASRVEQLAEPGRSYLTGHTARLVEGFFQLRDLGEFEIKGVAEPIRVHELEGVGSVRSRLDISRARGFSRFVGRVDKMATLEGALRRAREGHGQVVGVVGQEGVGKSRLCLQFVEQCRARGIRVLEAHCPAHGKTVPLLPILELLRNSFGITAEDTDQAAREKIAGRLLLLDRAFDDVLPLVFDFLGVPDPEKPPLQMDPEARQRQLYGFVRRLVQARSEREPAVLLFDDIQWIDEGSDAYLTQLVEATSGTRTLLLANFRPEYHAEWMGKSDYQQLPLSPLGPEAIDELLHELLGSDPTLAGLYDRIRERTGGNPFFIEEVVQSLAESESLSGARGAYRLLTPIEELAIPATVQAVLAARIDRLPEREKQVLQTAAVATAVDKRFSESLLGQVAGMLVPDLAAALSRLQADEFIKEEALYPEMEYAFKHPLTQQVAYDSQLSERREQIHSAVARVLEELPTERLDAQAALIAYHWKRAREEGKAGDWQIRAILRSVAYDALIGGGDRTAHEVRLGAAKNLSEEWKDAVDPSEDVVIPVARGLQVGVDYEVSALIELSAAHRAQGKDEHACDAARRAVDLCRDGGLRLREPAALYSLARALLQSGGETRLREAEVVLARCSELVGGRKSYLTPRVHEARAQLGNLLGDHAEAERHLREAHRLYTEMGATGHAERVARELDS